MVDFSPTPEQTELRDAIVRFAKRELSDDIRHRDAQGEFSRELWQKCARLGIQGLPIPEEYGGNGLDALTTIMALEALGYACKDNGLLFSLNAQMWSCQMPILRFGREDLKRRYLPGLCDGSLIAGHAMSEPDSGSDAFSLRTTAELKGNVFILNGAKTFCTNAPVADIFVVFARTDPSLGFAGLSAFVVDRETPGLSVGRELHKMGLRTSPMGEVAFQDCEVPEGSMIGGPGSGMAIFNHSMEWERGCILACAVGVMQRQVEECVLYAKGRVQFGHPISKFQSVAHRIVDMQTRLETARFMLYRYGWLKASGRSAKIESAMAKLVVSEMFLRSSLDALQIYGGYGYMVEFERERDVRDAVGSRLYSGTSDIQKNIIAGGLGL